MPERTNETKHDIEPSPKKLRVAFLASHNGTDMKAIIEAMHTGLLNAEPVLLISNNSTEGAMRYAQEESPIPLETRHISNSSEGIKKTDDQVDELIRDSLLASGADVVVLCGYMKRIGPKTIQAFENRILNVHPALLPDLKGHWGDKIHEEVIRRRREHPENEQFAWTGVTIHFVDEEYDHGEHVLQERIWVKTDEASQDLKNRVQQLEKEMYIKVLSDISSGTITLGKVKINSKL